MLLSESLALVSHLNLIQVGCPAGVVIYETSLLEYFLTVSKVSLHVSLFHLRFHFHFHVVFRVLPK